jgi:hypothetical protein
MSTRVHCVYIVPSDKEDRASAEMANAFLHLQAWYRWQLAGKTFDLTDPIVQVCHSEHDSSWYSTFTEDPSAPHSEWYWANAQRDARDLAGARFYMPDDTWAVYLDAEPEPDQHAGGASVNGSGICVLTQSDIDALLGQHPTWTLCREIGGLGHEVGHTFGLPHPPAGQEFGRAIMGTGYMTYPDCILTDADKIHLNANQFFHYRPWRRQPEGLCHFIDTVQRPHPLPRPRPQPLPRGIAPIRFWSRFGCKLVKKGTPNASRK